jgi:bifunctional ADP-heptose synthase (sugar kinase/adenylyltransferase)
LKVLLIGDTCIDRYVYGTCSRLSPEGPVPVLEQTRIQETRGMAWNVRDNLMAFGIDVYIMTNEEMPIKTRFVDEKSNHQIMRLDEKDEVKPFEWEIPDQDFDAMVISDYNKGLLTEEKIFELCDWFKRPVFIDSKKTNLPRQCFIKLNDGEAQKLEGKYPFLITTKGSEGATFKNRLYPGTKVPVFDVAGAGDTFLSALVFHYLNNGIMESAIPFANKAAAIAVSNPGTYVLTEGDINEICS